MTLKQRYVSQLSDCNNVSIAKTLLKQMPQITFTQFCNKLARVLVTCQHAVTKASVKTVTAALVETKSEEEGVMTKPKLKRMGRSVLNPPRLRTSAPSWTRLWLRISKSNISAEGIYKCHAGCPDGIQINRN